MSLLIKNLMLAGAVAGLSLVAPPVQAAASLDFKKAAVPFMEKYCYECHGGKSTKADLDLKAIKDDKNILENHKLWRNVLQQVNSGEMPPKKFAHKPTPADIEKFNNSLTHSFTQAEARQKPDPGHVTARRLNKVEYNNTVRDLTGVDYFPAENFPADDIGHGFDNIGDVLSISPVHLERYLDAAEGIAQRSVFLTLPKPNNRERSSNFLSPRYGSEESNRPMTNSEPDVYYGERLEKAGDYVFRVRVRGTNAPDTEPPQFALLVDEKEVGKFTWTVETNNDGQRRSRGWRSFEVPLSMVSTGEHKFALRYLNQQRGEVTNRMLYVNAFQIIGPADTRSDFMKRVDALGKDKPEAQRIQQVTEWFLGQAFRRPPTKEEVVRYVGAFESGMDAHTNRFEAGLQQLVKVALCSPKFLFRAELDDKPKTKDSHPLDEYQLASRLSYFFWSTMPDEELFALAGKKQLTGNLDAQVRRMLKDPKATALVQNFGLQWLQIQRLATFSPDNTLFPGFDERLRKSMLKETELFIGEIIREDHSILTLVDADFTYLNRTLARHYGIEDKVFGSSGGPTRDGRFGRRGGGGDEFTRVTLPDKSRGGLLTQASILTVTSNPTRTSPVKRGKWVLEQILGTPPPPAPPGVEELEAQHELKGSLRQRMEQHRANPACANCHQQMDAMGFAFENFDAIGRFRTKDGADAIDPSGVLPDGQSFKGPGELKTILTGKKDLVARNVTEKLMTYALGRGLEYYDERTIKQVVTNLAQNDYKFSALVTSIVQSDPFRLRRGKELKEKYESGE